MKYRFFPLLFFLFSFRAAQKSQFTVRKRKRFYLGAVQLNDNWSLIHGFDLLGGRKHRSVDWRRGPLRSKTRRKQNEKFQKRKRRQLPESNKVECVIDFSDLWNLMSFFLVFLCNKILTKKSFHRQHSITFPFPFERGRKRVEVLVFFVFSLSQSKLLCYKHKFLNH